MGFYKERRKCHRPARTCLECYRRKIKCSRTTPCTNCELSKQDCVYTRTTTDTTSNNAAQKVAQLSENVQTRHLLNKTGRPATIPQSHPHQVDASDPDAPPPPNLSKDPKLAFLNDRIDDLERVFTTRALDQAGAREMYSAQPMLQDGKAAVNKNRIFGGSHWLNIAYQFSEMQDFFESRNDDQCLNEVRSLRLEVEELFKQCKCFARAHKSSRPSRCFPPVFTTTLTAPPRELAEQMSRLYFSRFESPFRILHIPSYWLEFGSYYQSPGTGPLTTLLKIQLVTAIGQSLQPEGECSHEMHAAAVEWVQLAQSWVSGLFEKDRLSLNGIQIQCLLILARQTLATGGDLIWISVGTLLRTAMQMGLHRDPKHFPQMPFLQAEMRRRLWATVLELTVQSSLDSGMPPMISLEDYDTAYPMDINDDELDSGPRPRFESWHRAAFTDMSLQLVLLKAIPVRLQILRSLNGLRTESFYGEVLEMSARLSGFCQQCTRVCQMSKGTGCYGFKGALAELLLKRFLPALHAPFATRSRENQAFRGSREVYLSSTLAVFSPDLDADLVRLLVVGGGIFKSCVISASLIVSKEAIAVTEALNKTSIASEDISTEKIGLESALQAATSLAEKRLCAGETNVKLFSTLNMTRGHVTALRDGGSVRLAIAKHAKHALEKALEILKAQNVPHSPPVDPFGNIMPAFGVMQDDYSPFSYPFDFTATMNPFYQSAFEPNMWYE